MYDSSDITPNLCTDLTPVEVIVYFKQDTRKWWNIWNNLDVFEVSYQDQNEREKLYSQKGIMPAMFSYWIMPKFKSF